MVAGIAGWHISRDFTLDSYIAIAPLSVGPHQGTPRRQGLLGFPGVMLLAVDIGVIFEALQVSDNFGGHVQFGRKALLQTT